MRNVLAGVIAAALLSGCAAKPEMAPPSISSAKTVTVIPGVGSKILVATTGITVFENNEEFAEIPEWNLDALVAQIGNEALSKKFTIITPSHSSPVVDYDTRLDKFTRDELAIQKEIRQKVSFTQSPDLIVAIALSNSAQAYQGQRPVDYGVGVSKWYLPIGKRAPHAHTFLEVILLDGHTLKELSERPLIIPPSEKPPMQDLKDFEWTDHWADMTPAQREQIHQALVQLLRTSIPYTLNKMNLGG
ncbi:MAG TPA: hypothetical protein VM661_10260 [Candidatus Sulfotelmatobacter sp.]|nr:hypothetical protein [Candidatus Sulfotelmatobacter sp.]